MRRFLIAATALCLGFAGFAQAQERRPVILDLSLIHI